MIAGVEFTPLKRIYTEKGDVLHGLKVSENSFHGFGEAYFSVVNYAQIKGWKKHSRMILNLVVPVGGVRFVMFDDRIGSLSEKKFSEVVIGENNYGRLTIPAGIWVAFQGVCETTNLLLNIADIEHDPSEAEVQPIEYFEYHWS